MHVGKACRKIICKQNGEAVLILLWSMMCEMYLLLLGLWAWLLLLIAKHLADLASKVHRLSELRQMGYVCSSVTWAVVRRVQTRFA